MKKRGNQTRKGRRQNTKKRRVQVRQRKSRKMVRGGGVSCSGMGSRKNKKCKENTNRVEIDFEGAANAEASAQEDMDLNNSKLNVTISSRKPGETYHVFTPQRIKYTSDLQTNLKQGLPFGYDPWLDPNGSRLAELQKDENERLKQILGKQIYQHSNGKYYEYPEQMQVQMQDPESIQSNAQEARKKAFNSSIEKHINKPIDFSEIYKNIESRKFYQENPMKK